VPQNSLIVTLFLYSKDDPFEDLTQSEWERLDNAATEAYNTTLENEGIQQIGKCFAADVT
jgi:hypothetical protein